MDTSIKTFSLKPWILATRPKTLIAGTSPVILASVLAFCEGTFKPIPAILCLFFAMTCQIGANWINDLADYHKGADHKGRIGPRRMVTSGEINPSTMKNAIIGIFSLAFIIGCGLIPYAGAHLIIIGLLCILGACLYSAGPLPFAYLGLGDIVDFIFFGFIATIGTYYVQTLTIHPPIIWIAFGIGCMINNILLINNMRDMESDTLVGKKTIIVRFGRRLGYVLYRLSWLCALAVPAMLWSRHHYNPYVLLPIVLYFRMWTLHQRLLKAHTPEDWRYVFEGTAKSVLFYTILFSLGMLGGSLEQFFRFNTCF